MNSNFLFFNKEGYPHNFQYDETDGKWEGKIIFDENSNETFKTQSLHIFEKVDPIEFSCSDVDLVKIAYYNFSGITLTGEVNYTNEIITNIQKVNDSDIFYSKWIYGDKFDKKFPKGTIITFSGVTGTYSTSGGTDFLDTLYYTVVQIKKNAIMIITNSNNQDYDFIFSSGYIRKSLNVISINDYNQNFSGTTFFTNIYENKKYSILNSNYNDSIVTVNNESGLTSGITYSYINELKLNGHVNQRFTLRVKLLTERQKLFQGNVNFYRENNIYYLNFGKLNSNLYPTFMIDQYGIETPTKEIIFQDDDTSTTLISGFTFIIKDILDQIYVGQKELNFKKYKTITSTKDVLNYNVIEYTGTPINIIKGDSIRLFGLTGSTNFLNNSSTIIKDQGLTVLDSIYTNGKTRLYIDSNINIESGSTYKIYKILRPHQLSTVIVTPSGSIPNNTSVNVTNATCYNTNITIDYDQLYLTGITYDNNTTKAFTNKYNGILNSYGINVYPSNKNGYEYLTVESMYGTRERYFDISGYTNGILIPNDFSLSNSGSTTYGLTNRYDIILKEKLTNEKYYRSDEDQLCRNAEAEILLKLNYDIPFGTGGTVFGFRLTLNGNQYFEKFTTDTQTTINNFIDNYTYILYINGFYISSGASYSGYTALNLITTTPDTNIWELEVMVNILSSYQITKHIQNRGIIISGNEVRSTSCNFYNFGLATGMIISISKENFPILDGGDSFHDYSGVTSVDGYDSIDYGDPPITYDGGASSLPYSTQKTKQYNIIGLSEHIIALSYQGSFIDDSGEMFFKTREFIRKPRGEYYRDVYLRAYWEVPYDGNIDESIFFYDTTGDQLIPYNNMDIYKYIGPKPLVDAISGNTVFLNKEPNSNLERVSNPKYQQTVFDELLFKLEQLDSSEYYDWIPEPLEIFIGYNSQNEGVNYRVLKIEKIDYFENTDIQFRLSGYTTPGLHSINNFYFENNSLYYDLPSFNFIGYGFEKDQIISFNFVDQSTYNQIIFENIYNYKILNVSKNEITIDSGYTSGFTYFTTTGSTFKFNMEVLPTEILSCSLYGQTEIEDVRFKVNLNNIGIQIEDEVYPIFYRSDIQDNAIDWTIMNQKRKELLTTYREIYDYIGSYKALINSINYFGYNDLYVYEYYRNVDQNSELYNKLHKVMIPDIFDNTVEGWHEIDFISDKYQNQNIWKKTNLFNLAYRITDENGENVLIYTLDEVQYKLTKLKNWLRKNIIPISANLVDLTGVADTTHTLYQDYDESNQTFKSVVERNSTVVNFNYTATLNFDENYLITVNFYVLSGNSGTTIDISEKPLSFSAKIKTFFLSGDTTTMIPVQYFKLNKTDLKPFSFTLNKTTDPYIYIETTTYDNTGNGIGYVNNKMFFYDEPRNYWLVNHNFDMSKMHYYQTTDYIKNTYNKWTYEDIENVSTFDEATAFTITQTNVNTLNKNFTSNIGVD